LTKHIFIYLTDNLVGYVSWKQAWGIWLDTVSKDQDDYSLNSLEAETHLGRFYYGKMSVELTEEEYESMQDKRA